MSWAIVVIGIVWAIGGAVTLGAIVVGVFTKSAQPHLAEMQVAPLLAAALMAVMALAFAAMWPVVWWMTWQGVADEMQDEERRRQRVAALRGDRKGEPDAGCSERDGTSSRQDDGR